MFAEHVEFCGEPFKEEILKKVLELKGRDYKLLTNFVRYKLLIINRLKNLSKMKALNWFK
jgi:hypothetical protein